MISSGPAAVFCLGEICVRIFDVIFFWSSGNIVFLGEFLVIFGCEFFWNSGRICS